jgi:hypothetical protein
MQMQQHSQTCEPAKDNFQRASFVKIFAKCATTLLVCAFLYAPSAQAQVVLPPADPGSLQAQVLLPSVVLPPVNPGSFSTTFDFGIDQRLVTFSGFEVRLQSVPGSSRFNLLGTLPLKFLGGSDPAFVLASPKGTFFVLSAGAGGSKFPDPAFNGNIFLLPRTGGQARLLANIPFNAAAAFRKQTQLLVNSGEETFSSSKVVNLDLQSGAVQTVIAAIPGASGGVGIDRNGDVYTGIGADPNRQRTGEIRRFTKAQIDAALASGIPLDFDRDGAFVAKVLSAGGLVFDQEGDLWVAGGDLLGNGEQGFIAELNPRTGEILRRIDPTDGNPDGGPQVFFSIRISKPFSCILGANDAFDTKRRLFTIDACETLPPY